MQEMPVNMVGDGKNPNVFFVSDQGVIVTITRNFGIAYKEWRRLSQRLPLVESCLEDRQYGVICDVCPVEDDSPKLTTRDDSGSFLRWRPSHKQSYYEWNQ